MNLPEQELAAQEKAKLLHEQEEKMMIE